MTISLSTGGLYVIHENGDHEVSPIELSDLEKLAVIRRRNIQLDSQLEDNKWTDSPNFHKDYDYE